MKNAKTLAGVRIDSLANEKVYKKDSNISRKN